MEQEEQEEGERVGMGVGMGVRGGVCIRISYHLGNVRLYRSLLSLRKVEVVLEPVLVVHPVLALVLQLLRLVEKGVGITKYESLEYLG